MTINCNNETIIQYRYYFMILTAAAIFLFSQAFASKENADVFSTKKEWKQAIFDAIQEKIDKQPVIIITENMIIAKNIGEELKNKFATKSHNVFICDIVSQLNVGDIMVVTKDCYPEIDSAYIFISTLKDDDRIDQPICGRYKRSKILPAEKNTLITPINTTSNDFANGEA